MIGTSFESETEMFSYYRDHGKKIGFLVMWRSINKGNDERI